MAEGPRADRLGVVEGGNDGEGRGTLDHEKGATKFIAAGGRGLLFGRIPMSEEMHVSREMKSVRKNGSARCMSERVYKGAVCG